MARLLLFSVIIVFIIPVLCTASTPPVQPSLLFTVSNDPAGQNTSFQLMFTWNGHVSYNIPPEYIVVEVFCLNDGSRLGTFSVHRENEVCEAEHPCTYRSSVSMGILPSGEYMLAAHDPLSGVTARHQVTVSSHEEGTFDFFDRSGLDQAFFVVTGILAVFLVAVLVVLAGDRKNR